MQNGAVRDHAVEGMQAIFERSRDSEVRARTAKPPEQVGVFVLARVHEPTVCRDDVDREEVVDREAEPALQPSHPAAECQTRGAGVRDDADRTDEPERLRLVVEVAEEGAAAHACRAVLRIDAHVAHAREVDHDAVVTRRQARDAVPAAPHRDPRSLPLVRNGRL